MSSFNYKLHTQVETIGPSGAALSLKIESLASLDDTIDELFAELERQGDPQLLESLCPYFGVIWPSARGLAEYLVTAGRSRLEGKKLLEVGCGLALPSLVASHLGAQVVATDFHPDIPRFLERNLAHNPERHLEFVPWDWQKTASPLGQFDWVVGSDILYERQHAGPVARMLAHHVAPGGRIVLADPGRPYLQDFADEMKKLGYDCRVLTKNVSDKLLKKDVFVLELAERTA